MGRVTDRMRTGFTLVEMIVVIAMIAIIMGSMTASVQKARERARIARATQEVREMTNAILAYEQYAVGHTLDRVMSPSWTSCSEGNMKMILGGETGANGEKIPVLFNAMVKNGELRDPWGTPYQYMIDKTAELTDSTSSFETALALPNYYRLTDRERSRTIVGGSK